MSHPNRSEEVYLDVDQVLDLYADEFGYKSAEEARLLLRSPSALEGALARPVWYARLRNADLALQAAVLAHGIAEGQPFLDGNKRMALIAAATFFAINGFDLNAASVDLFHWMLRLSEGMTTDQLADLLRPCLVARE